MITIGIFLLVLVIALVSMALVLGFAIGIGWLLTLFLPFTLFEASLLGIIASVIVGTFWYNLIGSVPVPGLRPAYDEDDEDDNGYEDEYDSIPASRFYKTKADKTWEAWLRYQIANDIYVEFQDSPQPVAPLSEQQRQELSIRLADITIDLLKAKTARAKHFKVTIATLKRQMAKIGQRPYDDDILKLATAAINDNLDYHHEDIINVIRANLWETPSNMFDY